MIDAALGHIASQLNQALQRRFRIAEDLVVLSNILEQDGAMATHIADKLVVSLVNIERETVTMRRAQHSGAEKAAVTNPPVCLNLSVMFAANFSGANYAEALKFISSTIGFFQSRPVIDHQNTPELDARIERLTLEIQNLGITELNNLWGILSGKYLPSILYKVRMLTLDAGEIAGETTPVLEPWAATHA